MIVEQILSGILAAVASYCKRMPLERCSARVAAGRGVKEKYSSYVLMTFLGLISLHCLYIAVTLCVRAYA